MRNPDDEKRIPCRTIAYCFLGSFLAAQVVLFVLGGGSLTSFIFLPLSLWLFPMGLFFLWSEQTSDVGSSVLPILGWLLYALLFAVSMTWRTKRAFLILLTILVCLLIINIHGCLSIGSNTDSCFIQK